MVFNSIQFAIFLPIVFALHWVMPPRHRWAVLLAASYVFYAFCGVKYLALLLAVTGIAYTAGRFLERSAGEKTRRLCLSCAVLSMLAFLFFYKYFNFFSQSIASLLGLFGSIRDPFLIRVALPVGISFYIFTAISYVADVYRGKIPAEHHFGKFALYIGFFPSLLSGPIERADNLLPQLRQPKPFDYDLAVFGLREILIGCFKKMVVADRLAAYVNIVFADVTAHRGFMLIVAVLFYTVQIYCDFSGYSDIAIGVAKLFGISLRPNFRSPYNALSIKEFWGRWHISLSSWFRDYVYIPLGGNRVSPLRHKLNLMITFLVSGLWHGASWNFIIWGGIHGAVQILEALFGRKKKAPAFLRWLGMMVIVSAAWVFFRANTLSDALYVFAHCLDGIQRGAAYLVDGILGFNKGMLDLLFTSLSLAVWLAAECFGRKDSFAGSLGKVAKPLRWCVYLALILLVIFLTPVVSDSGFLYFQF